MRIVEKLVPILERVESGSVIKIVSYRFEYEPAWDRESEFYNLIKEFSKDEGISVMLLGGMPSSDEYKESLQKLYDTGADIRILEEPPTAHLFVYNSPSGKNFVWVEAEHKNYGAKVVPWFDEPDAECVEYANKCFDELWDTGAPFDEILHAE